jgi:nucleoid-associated protein YgaU
MIRLALSYLGIVVVLCAMVILDPMDWLPPGKSGTSEAVAPAPVAQGGGDSAARVAEVLENTTTPPPASGVRAVDTDLQATTAGILAHLRGEDPVAAVAALAPQRSPDDSLQAQSQSVAAELLSARGLAVPSQATGTLTLQVLVAQAIREGQPDDYIDALVNEAAKSGVMPVPSMLVTAEGRVDTAVLLATLVSHATQGEMEGGEFGEGDRSNPADDVPNAEAAIWPERDVSYVVRQGDSLGSIALRFYGDAEKFPLIFDANRSTLTSPSQIRVGQHLLIPAKPQL